MEHSLALHEYKRGSGCIGKCIIINNHHFNYDRTKQKDRDGTEVDAQNAEKLFTEIGYEVEVHTDLNVTNMSIMMTDVARQDHSSYDSFMCIILSHGEEGVIYGTDGTIRLDDIIGRFKGDNCASLVGKPKIFLVQACRGRRYDFGSTLYEMDVVDSLPKLQPMQRIPTEADVFIAYSVVPGHFSWRNNFDGSWFIQAVCTVFSKFADNMDLQRMMTVVCQCVAINFESNTGDEFTMGMKQVPCIVSTLRKLFYLQSV